MFARREEDLDQKRYMESGCQKDTDRREKQERGGHSLFIGGVIFPARKEGCVPTTESIHDMVS